MPDVRTAYEKLVAALSGSGLVEACGLTLPPVLQLAEDLKKDGFEFDSQFLFEDELVEGVCKQLN